MTPEIGPGRLGVETYREGDGLSVALTYRVVGGLSDLETRRVVPGLSGLETFRLSREKLQPLEPTNPFKQMLMGTS